MKAGALKYGARLRVASGAMAIALGGYIPTASSGEMWDITTLSDHDFFIVAADGAYILVHNDPDDRRPSAGERIQRGILQILYLVGLAHNVGTGNTGQSRPPTVRQVEERKDSSEEGSAGGDNGIGKGLKIILPPPPQNQPPCP